MAEPEKAPDTGIDPRSAERRAVDDRFSLIYEELRRLASFARNNGHGAALSSTTLVHETWLKMKGSPGLSAVPLACFKAVAANAMRQVLVDEARRRSARKRGGAGEAFFITLDHCAEQPACCDEEIIALHDALEELARLNPRQARMVETRFFAGLNVAETAEALGISESAVERDWRAAKAWLAGRIRARAE